MHRKTRLFLGHFSRPFHQRRLSPVYRIYCYGANGFKNWIQNTLALYQKNKEGKVLSRKSSDFLLWHRYSVYTKSLRLRSSFLKKDTHVLCKFMFLESKHKEFLVCWYSSFLKFGPILVSFQLQFQLLQLWRCSKVLGTFLI